jgi:hypothetical protein
MSRSPSGEPAAQSRPQDRAPTRQVHQRQGDLSGSAPSSHVRFVKQRSALASADAVAAELLGSGRVWALPVPTSLATSDRYCRGARLRDKS